MALQTLNQWLQNEVELDVSDTNLNSFESIQLLEASKLENHPLSRYWQNELELATTQKKVANSVFLPKLSAQYGIQKIGNQTGFSSYQVGIQIPLIFNKARGRAKASKLNAQIIEETNKAKEAQLKNRFSTILAQYIQLEESWNYYKSEALPLAKEQRNGVILSFKEGAMDYIAFLQNMKSAIELEVSTWEVLQQYLESKIQLEYFLNNK